MIPLSQTLLLASYPRAKAGTAMAMWAMTTLVAPVAGPLLGGWITDNIAWPWIFYINIPVGLVAAAVTWSIYRKRDPGPRKRADRLRRPRRCWCSGSARCRSCSTRARSSTGSTRRRSSRSAVVAVVGFAFFLVWELTEEHPIVDLRLFARRNFLMGTLALSVAYGLFFGNVVLLPLWLQQYMGYTATLGRHGDWRRWACWRSCSRRGSARTSRRIDPRKLRDGRLPRSSRWCCGCARSFNTQADFETILMPDAACRARRWRSSSSRCRRSCFSGLDARAHAGGGRA